MWEWGNAIHAGAFPANEIRHAPFVSFVANPSFREFVKIQCTLMNNRRGCTVAVLLFLAVLAVGVWRVRTPPTISRDVRLAQLPAKEQKQRRQEAKSLTDELAGLESSARNKERKPFKIRATERVLNTLIQENAQGGKFPIRNVIVGIEPHKISLQGDVEYKGVPGVATLTGDVVLENNQLAFKAESLFFGGVPVNQFKATLEKEITKRLNASLQKAPGHLNRVEVEADALVIEGVTD